MSRLARAWQVPVFPHRRGARPAPSSGTHPRPGWPSALKPRPASRRRSLRLLASGVSTVASRASLSRRSSRSSLMRPSRAFRVTMAALRIGDHVLHALGEGAQERLHRFRVLRQELRRDDDGVAVQLHAVVGVGQHHHVARLHAARLEAEQRGEGEAGDGVDVAARTSMVSRSVGSIAVQLTAADAVGLGEDRARPCGRGVEDRGAQTSCRRGSASAALDARFLQRPARPPACRCRPS